MKGLVKSTLASKQTQDKQVSLPFKPNFSNQNLTIEATNDTSDWQFFNMLEGQTECFVANKIYSGRHIIQAFVIDQWKGNIGYS